MFLEKSPARPSASLCLPGPLWPSGKPFARASRESEAAPLCLSVLRAVSDARRSCRRILLLRRPSCLHCLQQETDNGKGEGCTYIFLQLAFGINLPPGVTRQRDGASRKRWRIK